MTRVSALNYPPTAIRYPLPSYRGAAPTRTRNPRQSEQEQSQGRRLRHADRPLYGRLDRRQVDRRPINWRCRIGRRRISIRRRICIRECAVIDGRWRQFARRRIFGGGRCWHVRTGFVPIGWRTTCCRGGATLSTRAPHRLGSLARSARRLQTLACSSRTRADQPAQRR